MSPPVKIVVPPAKKKKIVLGGCQNVFPNNKYRKKLNAFLHVELVGTDCGDTFLHIVYC